MKLLFITRKSERCGVADYGKRLFNILKTALDITILETTGEPIDYTGYDIALYNYHYATLPFLQTLDPSIKHVALFHEAFQNIAPDMWIPVSELPRPLPLITGYPYKEYDAPVIGSFGFGFPDKDYVGIAKMVRREFNKAYLRLHIANAQFGDESGVLANIRATECAIALEGSDIKLEISNNYMANGRELVEWLMQNDINVFNCIPTQGRGISSSIDYALAARRPIGISNSEMYRHLPREICIDNISLPRLIAKGIEPLKQVYEDNSNERLIEVVKTKLGI
jgi:hypothetical protein